MKIKDKTTNKRLVEERLREEESNGTENFENKEEIKEDDEENKIWKGETYNSSVKLRKLDKNGDVKFIDQEEMKRKILKDIQRNTEKDLKKD